MKYRHSVSFVVMMAALLPGGVGSPTAARAGTVVSLELSLLLDVSGSIDSTEFNLQKTGYVNAFNSSAIQSLIAGTPNGIAVNFVYWSGASQQSQAVGWTHLQTATDAANFATLIAATGRPYSGLTSISGAINYGVASVNNNAFDGLRKVLDISGDGEQNDPTGNALATARANAISQGFTINGLPIGGSSLLTYYQNNVIGGPSAFAIGANSFNDFSAAITEKLHREISGVPEPAAFAQGGLALLVLGMYTGVRTRRRRLAAA